MKSIFLFLGVLCFTFNANAAVKVKNDTATKYAAQVAEENQMSADDASVIATLENDIKILNEELNKCEKQKKGWIAATVIGSLGVVSTGVAAGVQAAKISEKKDNLAGKQRELKELQQTSKDLDKTE
ncbi:MAG: hypothetical protein IKZ49_04180 [Alphaproteobacteria bacterium]|nr:hypothetical protein [Alphaproteobacteria bacterium]